VTDAPRPQNLRARKPTSRRRVIDGCALDGLLHGAEAYFDIEVFERSYYLERFLMQRVAGDAIHVHSLIVVGALGDTRT
jgi:hypothetical protein